MKLLAILLLSVACMGAELPTAPSHAIRYPAETYGPDERMIVHNSPDRVSQTGALFDPSFWLIHGLYAGALSFDLLETSRGVAHGCAEANTDLGSYPSNGHLVANGLIEFGAVLGLDIGMKAMARHNHLPRWSAVALGSIGAGIGTSKHIHGGYLWTQTGCL